MSEFFDESEIKKPKVAKPVKPKPKPPSKKVIPKTNSELELESAVNEFRKAGMIDD